jgi:hypothetical protein
MKRALRLLMKVFWFFFSKKNRLQEVEGRPRAEKERKRFFLKKEAKTFIQFTGENP